jgi:hypothetical protein
MFNINPITRELTRVSFRHQRMGSLTVLGTPIIKKLGSPFIIFGGPFKEMINIKAMEIYAILGWKLALANGE